MVQVSFPPNLQSHSEAESALWKQLQKTRVVNLWTAQLLIVKTLKTTLVSKPLGDTVSF